MGFLASTASVVRFVAQAPRQVDRVKLCEAVNRHAFREHDEDGLPRAEAFGWVAIHDPLVVQLETTDIFFQQYALLGFRYDRRVVPGKLLKLERRRLEEERRKELGLERIGRSIRREVKEEVSARLLQAALPSPSLFECAWNLETGTLYFTGKARGPRETFSSLFRATTNVAPVPLIPYFAAERIGLPGPVVDAFRAVEPVSLAVDAAGDGSPRTVAVGGAAPTATIATTTKAAAAAAAGNLP